MSMPEKPLVTIKPKVQDMQPAAPFVPDFNQPRQDQIVPQPIYMNPQDLQQRQSRREEPGSNRQRSLSVPARRIQQQLMQQQDMEMKEDVTADLTLALARGLGTTDVDSHYSKSSRNSLQTCSSGYGTQSTTPSCSAYTIASQDYDYCSMDGDMTDADYERFSTIPRNGDVSDSYQPTPTPKRPASTAGIPRGSRPPTTPTGTLRRNSSQRNKPPPPIRRTASNPCNEYLGDESDDRQMQIQQQPIYAQPDQIRVTHPASSPNLQSYGYRVPNELQQRQQHNINDDDKPYENATVSQILQHHQQLQQQQQQYHQHHQLQQRSTDERQQQIQYQTATVNQILMQHQQHQQRMLNQQQQQHRQQQQLPHYLTHRRSCSDMSSKKPPNLSGSATLSRKDFLSDLEKKFSKQIDTHNQNEQSNGTPTNSPTGDNYDSDSDSTPEASTGLMAEIKKGVRLRRVESNDRSAPRVA